LAASKRRWSVPVSSKRADASARVHREQARRTNRKFTDIAEAVALSVRLLPSQRIE